MFYVQHLLGTGHVKRAALLADAMIEQNLDVHIISGGVHMPGMLQGIPTIRLPTLRAKDQSFGELVDESGKEIDSAWKEERCRILLERYRSLEPDIVVVESFPFGRRKLRFELIPFLDAIHVANPRPLVVCSVRDIVQARAPSRVAETVHLLCTRFDHVMVHGDPKFVRFEESFPAVDRVAGRLRYTGYVAPPRASHRSIIGREEILVSGGGGAVSATLIATAIEAHAISRLNNVGWRILAGPNIPDSVFYAFKAKATGSIRVERNRDDFSTLLENCTVSVSQCGYNTMVDLIQSRARSIVVPFEGEAETEQPLRAAKLAKHGLAKVLTERELTPAALASAVDRCALRAGPDPLDLDLDGAAGSARFLLDVWKNRVDHS